MKKILLIAGILIVSGMAIAVAVAMSEPDTISGTWRYKMTVVVETPEGIKSGSAVREVNVTLRPYPLDTRHPYRSQVSVKGEAVVVDLGERGVLFVLMDRDGSYNLVFELFSGPPGLTPEGIKHYSQIIDAEAILAPRKYAEYARFVIFDDLTNPKTVKGIRHDNLEKYFGEGVALKEIIVEMVTDPLTWKIDEFLPWISSRINARGYLGGSSKPPFDDPTGTHLTGIEFSRGKYWLINGDNSDVVNPHY